MLWVTFGRALESVFLGCQDLGPSVYEQILISLELLPLLLLASCSGYKPELEALLLYGILRHAKFVIAKAHLVLGERHVVVVFRVVVDGLFIGASSPVFLFSLFKTWLGGVFVVFGIVRSAILSCVDIAIFTMA